MLYLTSNANFGENNPISTNLLPTVWYSNTPSIYGKLHLERHYTWLQILNIIKVALVEFFRRQYNTIIILFFVVFNFKKSRSANNSHTEHNKILFIRHKKIAISSLSMCSYRCNNCVRYTLEYINKHYCREEVNNDTTIF